MIKIRPTLFIGLGGTGMEIVLRIRHHILSHVWGSAENPVRIADMAEFPFAQFIIFDLDASSFENGGTHRRLDTIAEAAVLSPDEIISPSPFLERYCRNDQELLRYPHISSWLPVTPAWVRSWINMAEERSNHHQPTETPRCFSRLGLFNEYSRLKDMIEYKIRDALAGVSNRSMEERLGLDLEPASLRVVVIASTAGCTGSGSFLDMGFLSKCLAKRQISGAQVDLALMLPSGYSEHGKSRIEANTYAALMELETCMGQGIPFVKQWKIGEDPELPNKPFDDVFLFDTVNLAQKTAEATDLFDMVAGILFDDFTSGEFSNRKREIAPNQYQYKVSSFFLPVDAQTYGRTKLAYSKAYSALGQSSIDMQFEQRGGNVTVGSVDGDPLNKKLSEMSESERRSLFQRCLEMAMPWVEANLEGDWTVNPDQYSCVIGVNDPDLFEAKFLEEFKAALPARTRMPTQKIMFFESGVPGKLTCYVELSGVPLTALKSLPKWYESYKERGKLFPLHTHRDKTLFVHPMAPSSATLDRLAEHFKLYLQGIVLGVLKLRVDDPGKRVYCLTVSEEELSIGNERTIRLEGVASEHLVDLQKKVAEVLNRVKTPAQYAGLAALFEFYKRHVYPPAVMEDENKVEFFAEGFCNVMCASLMEEARKILKKKSAAGNIDGEGLIRSLQGMRDSDDPDRWDNFDVLDLWADEIEGSESDVYANEVGKLHKPKRILKREFFQAGWLEQLIGIGTPKPTRREGPWPQPGGIPGGPPPLPGGAQVYVAINDQQAGPFDLDALRKMAQSKQLTRDTLVWMQGMVEWAPASTVTAIAGLFVATPPPLKTG